MKLFSEELERRSNERRQKSSATWGGLLIKVMIFILLILLFRFMFSAEGKRFGNYWKEVVKQTATEIK